MISNILKLLTFLIFAASNPVSAQEVWKESFSVPEKGIWGKEGGAIQSDFSGITAWNLEFSKVRLLNAGDYAKTVTTSGGRFEVCDITGEVVWHSEIIDISEYSKVKIQLTASETGSGANATTKYLKAFYKLNNGPEILIKTNGENFGNWGSAIAEQTNLTGKNLQIIVYIANDYSADKVILDEVTVFLEGSYNELIEPGDLALNEILFNPVNTGSDFVEIYNNSKKSVSTNRLYLASRDTKLALTQIYQLSKSKVKLLPESYLVLTKDTNGVFPWFTIKCADCFLQMEKFPSFNNDEDYVVLLDERMQIIDEFRYTEKMHSPFLADVEGISLERISFSANTNSTGNWHSASSMSGYGTPGYINSQVENENLRKPQVTFSPESFSPNSDGYNDEYQIQYQLEKPGYIANVWIFDAAGRFVMQLAKNEILGTNGTITWNGKDETGQRQILGVYVVALEIFNTEGKVYRFKDGVVLTDILE